MAPSSDDNNTLVLKIKGEEIRFAPEKTGFDEYMNAVHKGNLSQGARNYILRLVVKEDRQRLKELMDSNWGAAVQIAEVIAAQNSSEIEIEVKKP